MSRPAHSGAFARMEPKAEWTGVAAPDAFRSMFGVKICDMGWTEALTYVELVSNLRQSPRTVSFIDAQSVLRLSIDADCRSVLGNRLLLPTGRTLALMARWQGAGRLKTSFDAASFVDALLTFVPRCHVALVGKRLARLEATRQHLSQHAPWHMFSIIRAADLGGGIVENSAVAGFVGSVPDLVIVDADDYEDEVRFEKAVALRHNGLIVMAGAAFDDRNP